MFKLSQDGITRNQKHFYLKQSTRDIINAFLWSLIFRKLLKLKSVLYCRIILTNIPYLLSGMIKLKVVPDMSKFHMFCPFQNPSESLINGFNYCLWYTCSV